MSKTAKFNASVTLGKTTYAAGEPVPIGGKTGLSEDEAANLSRNFGQWEGADTGAEGDDLAGIKSELKAAQSTADQVPKLEAEVVRLKANLAGRPTSDELDAEKSKVAELEEDAAVLATEVGDLKAEIATKDQRITALESEIADLKKSGTK